MIIVNTDRASHWYTKEGKPFYEIECARRPGQMRSVTLRDARKHGAVPSVTGIIRMKYSYALERWKAGNYIMAAATTPRGPDDSDDQWVAKVVEAADDESRAAREHGTGGHDDLEQYALTGYIPECEPACLYVQAFKGWVDNSRIDLSHCLHEHSFATPLHGYGGRVDLITHEDQPSMVADYKFTKSVPGKPMTAYGLDYGYQLAAYAEGTGMPNSARLLNLLFSKTEPGRMEVQDWTDQREMLWSGFQACLTLWVQENSYDPRKKG